MRYISLFFLGIAVTIGSIAMMNEGAVFKNQQEHEEPTEWAMDLGNMDLDQMALKLIALEQMQREQVIDRVRRLKEKLTNLKYLTKQERYTIADILAMQSCEIVSAQCKQLSLCNIEAIEKVKGSVKPFFTELKLAVEKDQSAIPGIMTYILTTLLASN